MGYRNSSTRAQYSRTGVKTKVKVIFPTSWPSTLIKYLETCVVLTHRPKFIHTWQIILVNESLCNLNNWQTGFSPTHNSLLLTQPPTSPLKRSFLFFLFGTVFHTSCRDNHCHSWHCCCFYCDSKSLWVQCSRLCILKKYNRRDFGELLTFEFKVDVVFRVLERL